MTTPTTLSIHDIQADADWLAVHRNFLESPERKLLLAILKDAILTATKPSSRACLEARDWLDEDTTGDLFSFVNVCEWLGLSATAVLRRVKRMPGYGVAAKHRRPEHNGKTGRPKKAA